MNTILTDDELGTIQRSSLVFSAYSSKAFGRAVEAAVLAKLAQQEPAGHLRADPDDGHVFEPRVDGDWSALGKDLYLHPAPQQADRQRVPDGWRKFVAEVVASAESYERRTGQAVNAEWVKRGKELLAAAPEAPAQEKSNG